MLNQLPELQLEQQRHDELAHRDILCLPVQDRIKHMVLHYAKYCGHLAAMSVAYDERRFVSTLVDTAIISLASANTLGMNLAEAVRGKDEMAGVRRAADNHTTSFFVGLARITGTMAKACESMDHLENFNYRGTLEESVTSIALLTFSVAVQNDLDLPALIRARWSRIERKFLPNPDASSVTETLRIARKA